MPRPAARTKRSSRRRTAAALVLFDTIRLADGSLAEHGLMAMASDLWAERPEASDSHWIASEWNGLTIAYRIDT